MRLLEERHVQRSGHGDAIGSLAGIVFEYKAAVRPTSRRQQGTLTLVLEESDDADTWDDIVTAAYTPADADDPTITPGSSDGLRGYKRVRWIVSGSGTWHLAVVAEPRFYHRETAIAVLDALDGGTSDELLISIGSSAQA